MIRRQPAFAPEGLPPPLRFGETRRSPQGEVGRRGWPKPWRRLLETDDSVISSHVSGYWILLAIAALFACDVPEPEPAARGQIPEDLGDTLERLRAEEGAPGLVVALGRGAETQYIARGWTRVSGEGRRPVQPTDPFFIGSATKTFTAVLVLKFVEEGRIRLSDRVDRWIPEFPSLRHESVEQLLRHRSGLADVYAYIYHRPDRDEMLEFVQRRWELEELLDLAGGLERRFDPGERFEYSSTNYLLLGVLLERISGESYASLLRSRIFAPLSMESTWLHHFEAEKRAQDVAGHLGPVDSWPHSQMFGELEDASLLDEGNMEYAAGGIVSTVADSLRFLQGLVGGEILAPESLEAMREFLHADSLGVADGTPEEMRYGLGLVEMQRLGYRLEGHGGIYNGWTAGLWYAADCDLFVVFWANRGFVTGRHFLDAIVPSVCGGS